MKYWESDKLQKHLNFIYSCVYMTGVIVLMCKGTHVPPTCVEVRGHPLSFLSFHTVWGRITLIFCSVWSRLAGPCASAKILCASCFHGVLNTEITQCSVELGFLYEFHRPKLRLSVFLTIAFSCSTNSLSQDKFAFCDWYTLRHLLRSRKCFKGWRFIALW